tara:strand:+ start:43 stop:219 length:177 start_codon:yes stop_codon:yes gene_type:complete
MIEMTILFGILWFLFVGLIVSIFYGAFEGGSKGIRKEPYMTKSGVERTATKEREEYIN